MANIRQTIISDHMDEHISIIEEFEKPSKRFKRIGAGRLQAARKSPPPVKILPNLTGIREDRQLLDFVHFNRDKVVVVNFGSSWCSHCHRLFPSYVDAINKFPQFVYALAQVDNMHEAIKGIHYTPTIAIYRSGQKIDEFFGANKQQLQDHLWLALE